MSVITCLYGESVTTSLTNAPDGIEASLVVNVLAPDGVTVVWTTTGVTDAGTGLYTQVIPVTWSTTGHAVTAGTISYLIQWVYGATSATDQLEVTPATTIVAGDLCSLAQVRAYLDKPAGDTNQDALISTLITRASELILAWTGREFTLADGGTNPRTRVFPVGGYWRTRVVPIGDMASAPTAVVVQDADGATVQTLTAGTDTEARPLNRSAWEPITDIYLRSTATQLAASYRLQVTGSFGFPSIPETVQQAAIITVGTWLRRDVSAFSSTFALDEARIERPESLPQAAIRMLEVWRAPGVA